jgi:hypothetical protein
VTARRKHRGDRVNRLRAVAELRAGASAQVDVGVGATLKLKRFELIPYRAALGDLPEHMQAVFG